MVSVAPPPDRLDIETGVVVIDAGACGLTAGLRALEAGAEAVVLERDPRPTGSTAMSSGFIPAPASSAPSGSARRRPTSPPTSSGRRRRAPTRW